MFALGPTPSRPKPKPTSADRDRKARWSRKHQQAVAEIGEIPPPANPRRRNACKTNLAKFLTTYFPASTGLKPFSEDHGRVISRIQTCVLTGGLFCQAVYRGFAKTTISENSAIWAVLYGHRRFVPIFGADAQAAESIIDSIKLELAENELLAADFPEVCLPIRALDGKPQRCLSQTHHGALTHIAWRSDTVILPTIPQSAASGAILTARGITAGSRGMKHKRPDGVQQRPDFVIIDDPQTDESAGTELQVGKRLSVIKKSILKLAGHNRKIAVVLNATVIRADDLIEQILDTRKNPAWQGERIPLIRKWADAHETLWLNDYARLRNTYDAEALGDQQRAHRAATDFYRRNRAAMDAGCMVSWQHCYDAATELSAIQHAYNALIDDGPEVFASECQNAPERPKEPAADEMLSAEAIAQKINGHARGNMPATASRVVAFIDVQKTVLYWMVTAWADGFTGYVIDYGTWPEQNRRRFRASEIRQTIARVTGNQDLEAGIYAALEAAVSRLMTSDWRRDDGAILRPERILIDAGWGDSTDVIYQFCRQSPHAAVLMPSHGRYVGAKSRRFSEWHRNPGDRVGLNWRIPNVQGRRSVRYVTFDSNWWKTFMHRRLCAPMAQPGNVSLFGTDPLAHAHVAEHLTAEKPILVTAQGRTVTEWSLPNTRPDNHWLDCYVGCGVAASERGIGLQQVTPAAVPRRKVTFEELKKNAKHFTAGKTINA